MTGGFGRSWGIAKNQQSSLDDVLRNVHDDGLSFSEWLRQRMDMLDIPRRGVFYRAQLDRVYGYQIVSGIRKGSRDKLIQLAMGMGMNIDLTCELLERAGYAALRPYKTRDAYIAYCISHYGTVVQCNQLLTNAGLEPLYK